MTPRGIVERAASLGVNIIAVCDHNSVENACVTRDLAKAKGIQAIPGMEINSSEEVHVLGLFPDLEHALKMQSAVYRNLEGKNDEDAFGMQVVVNEMDEVLGFNERLLIGATGLSVEKIVDLIHQFEGLAVASHIDREGFGIIGQLGFIPPNLEFDALELSSAIAVDEAQRKFAAYARFPWISSSDAHRIEDIGKKTTRFFMRHSNFEEICLALKRLDGRKVII